MHRIIDYYPGVIGQIREIQQITAAEDLEFERLGKESRNVLDNMYILTANETGIAKFEKVLGIEPDPNISIEKRRLNILTKYGRKKLNLGQIRVLIHSFSEGAELENDYADMHTKVILYRQPENIAEIEKMLEDIIPLNIYISFVYDAVNKLKIKRKIEYADIKYNYVLGKWKLGVHKYIDEGAVRNGEGVMNADGDFLRDVLKYVMSRIGTITVNGIEINNVSIEDKQDHIEIKYIVKKEFVKIEVIKILDIDGNIMLEEYTDISLTKDIQLRTEIYLEGGKNE